VTSDSRPSPEGERTYEVIPVYMGDNSPSLEPSKYRLQQAVIRLKQLHEVFEELAALAAANPMTIRLDKQLVDAGTWADPELNWSGDFADPGPQHQARLLTGEVVYHLRTALDYLAYHLVWLDRGRVYTHSQFPIVSDPERWPKDRKSVPGLTAAHLEQIRRLQPFMGCAWTNRLASLSNVDKHRSTLKLKFPSGAAMKLSELVVAPDPHDPSKYLVDAVPTTARLMTADGEDVLQVLPGLCVYVADTLNAFSPDFGEAADLNLTRRPPD
jgi:hypothetical protein